MEHLLQLASDLCDLMPCQLASEVCDLMPCQLNWCQQDSGYAWSSAWIFWSKKHHDELEYQQMSTATFDLSFPTVKEKMEYVSRKIWCQNASLLQFWVPIKVNGSTFLSIADQPFVFCEELNKGLCSYRKLCLDNLIPIEGLPGPPARVYSRCLPEYNPDVTSYSTAEFPLRESAIRLGVRSYYAFPAFNLHDKRCTGVFEILCTKPSLFLPLLVTPFNRKVVGLYSNHEPDFIKFLDFKPALDRRLGKIMDRLDEIGQIHSLPFAQIWIPYSQSGSLKFLYCDGYFVSEDSSSMSHELVHVFEACYIESGKALVGRAFASRGSCFCKDVTLLSINDYPLVPSARKARLTQSFAICLQSKCANNIVFVVECFLPSKELVVTDLKTFLNMLLSTMKEKLPDFIVASGKELGQRMLVEVVKVSPSDELDSFEIGQPLPSVQSLQDGGETTEIDSFCQQSNLQNRENNAAAALLVPSCSSQKCDSLNCEGTVEEVDQLPPHPIGEAVINRGTVNLDVAHDKHIEDTSEIMLLDLHFEQPNLEIISVGNAMTNNEKIHSHKNNAIQRIEKDHGITREVLEQHFGMTLADAAKNLHVSRATLKRIRKEYGISRWPHHKTRKVNVHVSQGVSFQDVEPCMVDQQCPTLSQEKGTDFLGHKRSPATGVSRDSLMTLKVTYRGDIIRFQLSLSSTRVELEGEVEKRLKVSLQRFSIKYQDEDEDWILITTDSDLRDGMRSLRLSGRTTMRLLVTPEADT